MTKKDILKTLDLASFISAVVAIILVLVFEFTGNALVMKYSLVMYAVCFLSLVVVLSFKVYFAFSKKYQAELAENLNVSNDDSAQNDAKDKKSKIYSIVYLVFASLALIFTFVMLIVY